jgi:hypothetical protein
MITGIGTPNSQSKIPRPITTSMNSSSIQQRERQGEVPAAETEKRIANLGNPANPEGVRPTRAHRNRAHEITEGRRDSPTVL